ncbi:hypothetical protein [Streptomyces sp. NBC_00038]|uniref:hypothetical protein n=1 Tax=Streptomyces sp. NBC_00038 TaxID=2903615 RepID=UPI0022524C41|nr:hypothetical protein [Streptomyces sp. NBC_00038]MCX5555374.1 hypothetical protein [Streptomyces sp. NBC_00038]
MGSDDRWQRRGSRVLFAGGPQGRIRLTVDEAVRPDGEAVAYPYVAAPDFSELGTEPSPRPVLGGLMPRSRPSNDG